MTIEVVLQQKKKTLAGFIPYESEFDFDECHCVFSMNNQCLVIVSGTNMQHLIEVFRVIWEVLCLYEGYFFKVSSLKIDGAFADPRDIYQLPYYKTGTMWVNSASSLVGENICIDQRSLDAYYQYRDQSYAQQKILRPLINSYFYLRSENYEYINFSHRLSILLNMCDGFASDENGDAGGLKDKYRKFVEKYITAGKFEYGISLLGIPAEAVDIYQLLRDERTSIDHFVYKPNSLSCYAHEHNLNEGYIITYLIYVLELALRIRLIEKFNKVSQKLVVRNIDNINDWVIRTLNLEVPCSLPENMLMQRFNKIEI